MSGSPSVVGRIIEDAGGYPGEAFQSLPGYGEEKPLLFPRASAGVIHNRFYTCPHAWVVAVCVGRDESHTNFPVVRLARDLRCA